MLTGWQSSKRICVAEHCEDEQQMSQCQVGEKTGKVVEREREQRERLSVMHPTLESRMGKRENFIRNCTAGIPEGL